MNRNILVGLFVLMVIFAGGFYWWSRNTASVLVTPANNSFSFENLAVGQKVGGLVVKSIENAMSKFSPRSDPWEISDNNFIASFDGQLTVSGQYTYQGGFGSGLYFVTKDLNIPHYKDQKSVGFRFDNQEFTMAQLTQLAPELNNLDRVNEDSATGTATIVISNYTFVSYPADVFPTAKLVKVIEASQPSIIKHQ